MKTPNQPAAPRTLLLTPGPLTTSDATRAALGREWDRALEAVAAALKPGGVDRVRRGPPPAA